MRLTPTKRPDSTPVVRVPTFEAHLAGRRVTRLFFDIENRPLSYWYDGNPTADITAIGWAVDDGDVEVAVQTKRDTSRRAMFRRFLDVYATVDVVIGHNIRRHDLPILNAHLVEAGLPQLEPRLTVDTLRDLPKWKDIPKSLEYLADWLGIEDGKEHMTQHHWRTANRLTPDGIGEAVRRVTADVRVTRDVWRALLERRLLVRRPSLWKP